MNWHLILEILMWLCIGFILSIIQNTLGKKIITKSFKNKGFAFLGYVVYSAIVFWFTILFVKLIQILFDSLTESLWLGFKPWFHTYSQGMQDLTQLIAVLVVGGFAISYQLWLTMLKDVVYDSKTVDTNTK